MRGGRASSSGGRLRSRPRAASEPQIDCARDASSACGASGSRSGESCSALKPSTGTGAPSWQARQSSSRGNRVARAGRVRRRQIADAVRRREHGVGAVRVPHVARRSASRRRRRVRCSASRARGRARTPSTASCRAETPRRRAARRRCSCRAAARSSGAWRRRPTTAGTAARTAVRRATCLTRDVQPGVAQVLRQRARIVGARTAAGSAAPTSASFNKPVANPRAAWRSGGLGHRDARSCSPRARWRNSRCPGCSARARSRSRRARIRGFEVALELPHVAELVGARETEARNCIGRDRVVGHGFAERGARAARPSRAPRQVLAGDADRFVRSARRRAGRSRAPRCRCPRRRSTECARRRSGNVIASVPSAPRCGPMPKWIRFSQ